MLRSTLTAILALFALAMQAQRSPLATPETFLSLGGTQELKVTVPANMRWKVMNRPPISTSDTRPPFFTFGEVISGKGNGAVKVIVPPNTEAGGRVGQISIEVTSPADANGNFVTSTTSVPIKQLAFAVSPMSLNFLAGGGTQTVTLTADSDWQVTDATSYLTVTPRSGSAGVNLSITCPPFPSGLPVRFRAASVTLSNGTVSRTIAIRHSK